MNTEGHEAVVRLVNSQLVSTLPMEELLAGSVDPDRSKYGRYVGIESKHHYDDGSSSSGFPHASDDIQQIVYNRCVSARKHWLADDNRNAAFHFGVATHFYMDGLICSPSVNEFGHENGDRQFAKTVANMTAPHVALSMEVGVDYVVGQIRILSSSFGKNDIQILRDAVVVLITLGQAITAPRIPENLSNTLERIAIAFSQRLREYERDFTNRLASKEAFNRLVASTARKTAEQLLELKFIVRCLVAADLSDNRKRAHLFPIVALVVRSYVRRRLMHGARKALDTQLDLYLDQLHSDDHQCREAISRLDVDGRWYCSHTAKQIKSTHLEHLSGSGDAYRNKLLTFKVSAHPKIKPRTRIVEEDLVTRAKTHGSALWEKTFSDWIGRESIEFRPLKYLWSAVPLSAPIVTALLAVFLSSPSWTTVTVIFVVSLLMAVGIWNMVSTCQSIRRTFQKWIQLTCPRCQTRSEIWVEKDKHIVPCPVCHQKLKLRGSESHETSPEGQTRQHQTMH